MARGMNKMPLVIGIDPGKDGGLCALALGDRDNESTWLPWGWRDFKKAGAWRHELPFLRSLLCSWMERCQLFASIEDQHSRPRDGHVGAFNFGFNYGSWVGLLVGLDIPYVATPPDVWEAAMGLTKNKTEHRHKAQALWPGNADLFRAKGADGLADAALLALFGTRFMPKTQANYHRSRVQCACTGFEHQRSCRYARKGPCL